MAPGATRPRRWPMNWPLPAHKRAIGFSFQLAINQHQFALHTLGYCHLCKDKKSWQKKILVLHSPE